MDSDDPVLCSAHQLAELLDGDQEPTVLDVRWRLAGPPARPEHDAEHVPGAVFVDLDEVLAAPPRADRVGGRHPLPDPDTLGAAMRAAGVRADRRVVLVDDGDANAASRAWWLLRHHGHPDVRILQGGQGAWVAAGLPVTDAVSRPEPGDWVPGPGRMPVVDADGAARVAQEGLLLDARVAPRYRGEVEPVDPVKGHVPGAVSAPAGLFVDAEGSWTPPADVRALLDRWGDPATRPVATYCGSGVTAAVLVASLARAGVEAALYVGSWSDWVSDPAHPVALGDGT